MSGPNEFTSRGSLLFFLIILVLFVALSVVMTAPYLLAVLIGVILMMMASPIYHRLLKRKVGPKLSSGLVTTGVALLVIGPFCIFTFIAIKQAIATGQALSENDAFSFEGILSRIENWAPVRALVDDPASLERQIRGNLQGAVKGMSTFLLGLAGRIPGLLLQLVLALLTCFFMLIDGRRFRDWVFSKLPLDSDVTSVLVNTFHDTAISVIWATFAAAGVQSAIMFLSFLVLGVSGAFLAGGATFLFAWIPMVGSFPVWLVGAIYLYMQGSLIKMGLMVGLGLFTGVIDNFIRPLVLKGRSELHPLLSLVVIFGGIQMFGIFGVFVGPIVISIVITLLEVWPKVAKRTKGEWRGTGG